MSVLESVLPHHEQIARLDGAVKALVSVVFPDPLVAAAGVLGCAAGWLRELGYSDAYIAGHLQRALDSMPSIEVAVRRSQMHEVPKP